ncbi:hypothetical protein, partial [Ellagibacter isourolithinifaciens]|uniref:hypothetical protein n=1 Tax=Ellagibacter isourolithinifaciens TaxID=2137581 RepID=UPI003A8FA76E
DHRSDATDDLCRMAGIDLTRQNMQLKDIKAVLAQASRWDPSPNKKKSAQNGPFAQLRVGKRAF